MSKKYNYSKSPSNKLRDFTSFSVAIIIGLCLFFSGCKKPTITQGPTIKPLPSTFANSSDSITSANVNYRDFFNDPNLVSLIDTALKNNIELLMTLQDINIAKNFVQIRHGAILPTVIAGGGIGIEKVGTYTSQGAGDAATEITPAQIVPENLTNFEGGLKLNWEIDIWGKLRNAKSAAMAKYLGSIEGRNFVLTNLIAEVANSYYELLSLDNQLDIIKQTIVLQTNQLELVKVQKEAAVVSELAVKQFEALLLNSQSMEFELLQSIVENENKINFLLGRYPQPIIRDKTFFNLPLPNRIKQGIPAQLLKNRPDIRRAEMEVLATQWETKVAQLEFLPSLSLSSRFGLQSFRADYLFKMPESLLYNVIGDLSGPIINRNALKAQFSTANAIQIQAMYEYQRTLLIGYVEVANELSNIDNLEKRYNLKAREVEVHNQSIEVATNLFKSARANYLEVLSTQREALASKLELVEVKKRQFNTVTNVYRALGGGWK